MKTVLLLALVFIFSAGAQAQTAPAAEELTQLLKEFLAGASRNDAAVHDRFWADDLIYTRSVGRRIGKADVLKDVRSAPALKPGDPPTTYSAEDIRIQQYGNTAVVAFRLVGETVINGNTQVAHFLNTGTFVKRNGKWQVVSWQSTRMARPDEEVRKEIAQMDGSFHQALLAADVKALERLVDESFIWTHTKGEQVTRQQLVEQLSSGQLKYTKLETKNVAIVIYGDTAVVRGISPRQRSAIPNTSGTGDPAPFDAFYTLTLVNRGGVWKIVAMHTSRRES
jgi:ketosteroid isomerase-like protein